MSARNPRGGRADGGDPAQIALQVSAWLGEAASDAFDAADPKATADKRIE